MWGQVWSSFFFLLYFYSGKSIELFGVAAFSLSSNAMFLSLSDLIKKKKKITGSFHNRNVFLDNRKQPPTTTCNIQIFSLKKAFPR